MLALIGCEIHHLPIDSKLTPTKGRPDDEVLF
jgi:hypothetical protein